MREVLQNFDLDSDVEICKVTRKYKGELKYSVWECVDCCLPESQDETRIMSTAPLVLAHLQLHIAQEQMVPSVLIEALRDRTD